MRVHEPSNAREQTSCLRTNFWPRGPFLRSMLCSKRPIKTANLPAPSVKSHCLVRLKPNSTSSASTEWTFDRSCTRFSMVRLVAPAVAVDCPMLRYASTCRQIAAKSLHLQALCFYWVHHWSKVGIRTCLYLEMARQILSKKGNQAKTDHLTPSLY